MIRFVPINPAPPVTNAMGTLNIVEMCSKANIPLIYAGSSSKHSGRFKNPYTFSKDVGEDIIELYTKHYNLLATTTRFYMYMVLTN